MTTRLSPELDHLGDALESAIRLQLARTAPAPTPVAVRRIRGRRAALVAAACLGTLAAGVGVAAASGVWDREDVAAGLSMSDVELAGSTARCAPVTGTTDTFDCTLLRPADAKDLPSGDVEGWTVVLNDDEGFVIGVAAASTRRARRGGASSARSRWTRRSSGRTSWASTHPGRAWADPTNAATTRGRAARRGAGRPVVVGASRGVPRGGRT